MELSSPAPKSRSEIPTISEAVHAYLEAIALARSPNTARTYRNALLHFMRTLQEHGLSPEERPVSSLKEEAVTWFVHALKDYASATERLYLAALTGFLDYLIAEKLSEINLTKVRSLIRLRARRPGQRLPQFPREELEKVLLYALNLSNKLAKDEPERLRNLRDRAFLLTLADTGLRVHEACALRRGDLDWNEGKAVIIGKGNRQDVIRFSKRALRALREYLRERANLDGATGRPLTTLPLFAQHGRSSGRKVKFITTRTGRNIVSLRVSEALGKEAVGSITPHSFRHYFVTTVLIASQGNLKLAQELARHRNIAVTQRYAHLTNDELDRGYYEIFDQD